jgi:hypothetical protein
LSGDRRKILCLLVIHAINDLDDLITEIGIIIWL